MAEQKGESLPRPGLLFLRDIGGRQAGGLQRIELEGERLILAANPCTTPNQLTRTAFALGSTFTERVIL